MKDKAQWFVMGVLVTAAIVFLVGATTDSGPQIGRYQLVADAEAYTRYAILDTATGTVIGFDLDGYAYSEPDWGLSNDRLKELMQAVNE